MRDATRWHDVKVVSQQLGHSSVGFTLDTYAHVLPSADVARVTSSATRRRERFRLQFRLQVAEPVVVRL